MVQKTLFENKEKEEGEDDVKIGIRIAEAVTEYPGEFNWWDV